MRLTFWRKPKQYPLDHPLEGLEWGRFDPVCGRWAHWTVVQYHENGAWMQCRTCGNVKWADV